MLHGTMPASGYRPMVGRSPTTPANSAGPRIEPSVSEPMAMGAYPAARPTADPVLEPPAVCFGLNGFFVRPCSLLQPHMPNAASGNVVLAIGIAPASISFCAMGAVVSGFQPAKPSIAAVESVPLTSMLPLTSSGTPSSGRRAAPLEIFASASAACSRALFLRISMHALRSPSRCSMASKLSCTRCTQVLLVSAAISFMGCGSDVRRFGEA
mmetsp:Transcript_85597/g.170912  ORF Transcript_85597/g.170912 Transcript_85597/m.170912 type:complete len:211 (+) Transcript_85597:1186-1818(+)